LLCRLYVHPATRSLRPSRNRPVSPVDGDTRLFRAEQGTDALLIRLIRLGPGNLQFGQFLFQSLDIGWRDINAFPSQLLQCRQVLQSLERSERQAGLAELQRFQRLQIGENGNGFIGRTRGRFVCEALSQVQTLEIGQRLQLLDALLGWTGMPRTKLL